MNLVRIFLFFAGNIALLQAQTSSPDSMATEPPARKPFLNVGKAAGIAIPSVMIAYGVISIESDALQKLDYSTRDELIEDRALWYNSWDNYFQFAPAALAFGLKMAGVESKNSLPDMLILYTLSNVLEAGVVLTAKSLTGRERPDGSNYHSFPSGHTATAFVAAEFLHQEYGDKSVWISVGGYGMASVIGLSRVYNNRHWVSDVVAGAGVGVLSAKMIYWLYPSIKKHFPSKAGSRQTFIFPSYDSGRLGVNISCTF